MAKLGFIQNILATIKNISNKIIQIDHKKRLYICLLITILLASILFKLFFWSKYQEGIDNSVTRTMPQSKLNVIFTDKTNKSSNQKYQIYTEYDKVEYDKSPDTFPYSTFIADPSGVNVNITMIVGDTTITIEPVQDSSLNTINDSSLNTINDSSLNTINDSSLNTINDSSSIVATFPKSMEIVLNFDKTNIVYYLKNQMSIDKRNQNKFSITNPTEIDISSLTVGGYILNTNYEQIGSVVNDNFNPYKYTIKFTDTTGVSKINIKFTTIAPV